MTARNKSRPLLVLFSVLVTALFELSPPLVPSAQAIVGRPLTPMSYAGVARRTTRRAAYVGATTPYVAPRPYVYPAPRPYVAPPPYAPPPAYYPSPYW